jgi:hypothetical protein
MPVYHWTYDASQLSTSALYQVRFLIGDTIAADPLIEDDFEITFCLSQSGENIYRAAAFACRRAAAKLARELTLKSPVAELDTRGSADWFLKMATDLDREAGRSGAVGLFAGGISVSDKSTRGDDSDRVVPSFAVDSLGSVDPLTDRSA